MMMSYDLVDSGEPAVCDGVRVKNRRQLSAQWFGGHKTHLAFNRPLALAIWQNKLFQDPESAAMMQINSAGRKSPVGGRGNQG